MKFEDIQIKHVYNVDFNNVRDCEFDGIHLAIVIKKNTDKKTAIMLPLTTSSNGEGTNKINIGKIASLPDNLKKDDSYAVYNQLRTVNCNRFMALKDDSRNRKEVFVDDGVFYNLVSLCIGELIENFTPNEKISYHREQMEKNTITNVVNLAYDIRRIDKEMKELNSWIEEIKQKIRSLLKCEIDYTKYISQTDVDNGIVDIIKKCI